MYIVELVDMRARLVALCVKFWGDVSIKSKQPNCLSKASSLCYMLKNQALRFLNFGCRLNGHIIQYLTFVFSLYDIPLLMQ